MAISIKNKIRLGTLFLFLLLVLSGGLSIFYFVQLKSESKNILKDNYQSLLYCHNMQKQLDSIASGFGSSVSKFEINLINQKNNITEPGEGQVTKELNQLFSSLKNGDTTAAVYNGIKQHIQNILTMNMQAIENKNKHAEQSSESASAIITLIAAITFLIALTFAFNFPSVVTTPIQKLTGAIQEISRKNYRQRVHLNSKDEFGQLAGAFNEMTDRLEEFENSNLNKLIFEKARAEAVINSLKDASIGIDKNDRVLFANQQALQLLGLKGEETVGKSIKALSDKNDLFMFLVTTDSVNPFKIVVEGKENYYVKEVIDVSQGGATNKVIVLKNITSFKELDVAKTNFIATVSHELKTPLASSDISLKLLEDNRVGQLTDEQKELVDQLRNDNQRMLKILSELLNMSQVEAGKIQLNIQSVSPYQIIESSVATVSSAAREKQILVDKKIGNNLPDIKADADKINWVLNNFLTNAIKYSPAESSILISAEKINDHLSFAVHDNGSGMEDKYLDRIFERYFQIPGRSDIKGSGIGLAICKEFIEAMDGKIWVKSKPGEGSTFGFDLSIVNHGEG
jgi:Signal transduction histidine kinase